MKSKIILLESNPVMIYQLKTGLEREGFDIISLSTEQIQSPHSFRDILLSINYLNDRLESAGLLLGEFMFLPNEHLLQHNKQKIHLRNYECSALKILYRHHNCVVSKEKLVSEIWNENDPKQKEHSLNNLICSIREKLALSPAIRITTIHKEGYKLSF